MVDHDEDRPDYEPAEPGPPDRAPPLRSTAPQSAYTTRQVGLGFLILVVGVAITFGLALVV